MQPAMIYCSSCGAGNQSQAIFCFSCGQKMLMGTISPSSAQPSPRHTGRIAAHYLLKGRYIITKLLGRGGMGAVYQATDTQFGNRLVAVKEMSQSLLDPQEVARTTEQFKQEAHLLASLQHPNLPSIYDHFTESGRWYLVMDFIEGETIEERLNKAQGHTLPLNDILDIGIQLTKVLSYLHTRPIPIIFRDLKPSNIMITSEGHVYLIDFGIARLFKPGQTRDTVAYGSPGYMAPEQFNHEQSSPLSDIYSLGATLHRLLSAHNPHSNKPTVFHFASLQSYIPTLPSSLVTLVSQMVNIDKNQRPNSMLIIRKKLEEIQRKSQYTPTQLVLPPHQNMQQPPQIRPQLPKHPLLRTLPIGIIAGIICVTTGPIMGTLIGLWFLTVLITCIMAGFLTGKIAVARRRGFFSGVIAGLTVGIIASIATNSISFNPFLDITITIIAVIVGGLLSLFGAWLATCRHPYYYTPKFRH